MHDLARATRILTQPAARSQAQFLDPTLPRPTDNSAAVEFNLEMLHSTVPPKWSPYGDNWELMWLGHCGARFPSADFHEYTPRGRVVFNDATVPQALHLDPGYGSKELTEKYPNHTRAIHHVTEPVCSTAYAVTQAAARRILYELGIREFSGPFDMALRLWCNGHHGDERVKSCLIPQPPYINLHRPVGRECDFTEISNCKSEEYNDVAITRHVRHSVRVNLPKFVEGSTDYIDSWPDQV